MSTAALDRLVSEVRACTHCAAHLPYAPHPVLRVSATARLLVIGQAPGIKVHRSGIPWNDASGKRLRHWMQLNEETFYDTARVAIVPMGMCYPGKGSSGDLPPRPECAPLWHRRLLALMPRIELIVLVGSYAVNAYLPEAKRRNLSETLKQWPDALPRYFPLVHPSPRNQLWLRNNAWFETEAVPALRERVQQVLAF